MIEIGKTSRKQDRVAVAIAAADLHESREEIERQFRDPRYRRRCEHYRSLAGEVLLELINIQKEAEVLSPTCARKAAG